MSMEVLNLPYSEIMRMTVMERRYWLGRKRKHYDELEEEKENGGTVKKGGKTIISGQAMKKVMKTKTIDGNIIPGL